MKTASITFIIFCILTSNIHGQKQFDLNDTAFQVGQIAKFDLIFELSGRHGLSPKSWTLADSIVIFLKKNNNLSVEFSTNSDYRGDSNRNDTMTKWRAESLRNYCIDKGIEPNRIEYKGFGERNPLVVDDQIHKKFPFLELGQELNENYITNLYSIYNQEIANFLNRRSEIKITKMNRP